MVTEALRPETAPRRHPDTASRTYDGEAFIVLSHSHVYKILNGVGTRVWDLIDGARTIQAIAETIAQEYDVEGDRALQDVTDFIGELGANGMLAPGDVGKAG